MFENLWGEIPPPSKNKLGLSVAERETLCRIPAVLSLEGPKLYQPEEEHKTRLKYEANNGDPLVNNTIELLRYKRQLTRLLETVEQYKLATASGEIDKMPPLVPPPGMPHVERFVRRVHVNVFGFPPSFEEGEAKRPRLEPVPDIGQAEAEAALRRAVIRLSAHVGYHTAKESAVRLLTEATELYLESFCRRLRQERDREASQEELGSGWPDIVEKVCAEMGVGSVLNLQDYYEDHVIRQHGLLERSCRELAERYSREIPGEISGWPDQPDEIPEMHFPSSDEGAGLGESMADHATPTLDAGMQMLQSLEASGDLDTPLSAESEVMSNLSCTTPSPALTPRAATGSPQLGSARKRPFM